MLSIFLTRELADNLPGKTGRLLYSFCSANDERRSSAVYVLRSWTWQALANSPEVVECVQEYFESPERTQSTLASPEALWIIFLKACERLSPIRIVCLLDGLDECDKASQSWFTKRLASLAADHAGGSSANVRLVILSRPLPGLGACARLKLDPDHDTEVRSDIEIFIAERVSELASRVGLSLKLRRQVQETLYERAQGTFLWVGYAITELLELETYTEIEERLADLPEGLPGIYARMLRQIQPQRRELCAKVLRWVTLAFRPLSVVDLARAVDVRATSMRTAEEIMHDYITYCGPILKVDGGEINLVHQSARDFLTQRESFEDVDLEHFRINAEDGHRELAWICLDVLHYSNDQGELRNLHASFKADMAHSGVPGNLLRLSDAHVHHSPLARYSAQNWMTHVERCAERAAGLTKHPSGFCQAGPKLKRLLGPSNSYRAASHDDDCTAALTAVACQGLYQFMDCLLDVHLEAFEGTEHLTERRRILSTLLLSASTHNMLDMARQMLCRGASLSFTRTDGSSPLHLAVMSSASSIDTIMLFLESGADIEAEDVRGRRPLHAAIEYGCKTALKLLLGRGASTTASDVDGRTALHYCANLRKTAPTFRSSVADFLSKDRAADNQLTMLKMLLDRVVCLDAADKDSNTALHIVSRRGQLACIRLLLEAGASVGAETTDGLTALTLAVGHELDDALTKRRHLNLDAVTLLLTKGAHVDAPGYIGTVLFDAIKYQSKELLQLLIARGANVNAADIDGLTALHVACRGDYMTLVPILLDSGADVHAETSSGATPLHFAAATGDTALVQRLLESGANVDASSKAGLTALKQACRQGDVAVAMQLLKAGANTEIRDSWGATPLHYAAVAGNAALVQLLLDGGADPHVRNSGGATPAGVARRKRHDAVAALLWAHINAMDTTRSIGSGDPSILDPHRDPG